MRLLVAALLALGFSSAAHAQEEDVRVAEFRTVCIAPATYEGYADAARAHGWTPIELAQSRLAQMVQMGQASMPGAEFVTFTREVNGASLDLMLSRASVQQLTIHGCGVFHSGGGALEPAAFAGTWLSGAPVTEEQYGARLHQWNQPLPGVYVVKLGIIPVESAVGQAGIFNGVTMSVDRVQR
jgi:hypothetical protein